LFGSVEHQKANGGTGKCRAKQVTCDGIGYGVYADVELQKATSKGENKGNGCE